MSNRSTNEMRNYIAELLSRKRNYRQEIKDITARYIYVVFYGCGAVLMNGIVENWNEHVGRKIDYCCDSDSSKWGKYFFGIKCLSPSELLAIKEKCAIFVTVGDFKPVINFLKDSRFPSVNQLYKYDLISSVFLENFDHEEIISELGQTYDLLEDKQSQRVFDAIVNRVLGDGSNVDIMLDVCEGNQYFPPDIIKLSEHERLVDIGAFNGDTIRDFISRTGGKFDQVFSFEVDSFNFNLLQDNIRQMPERDRIKVYNLGIWDSECDIPYSVGGLQSTTVGVGKGKGHVVPLDDILHDEKITFIKMDIEGAEPEALRGARNVIQKQKPILAICIYHDFRHLWEIPLYIKSLVPEYKIYLRHHTNLEYETVCYAIL